MKYLLATGLIFLAGCASNYLPNGMDRHTYEIWRSKDKKCYHMKNMNTGYELKTCPPGEASITANDLDHRAVNGKIIYMLNRDFGPKTLEKITMSVESEKTE